MPRKATPQALAIVGHPGIDEQNNDRKSSPGTELNKHIRSNNESSASICSPLTPLSPTTPKSPRSPFKFTLKPASYNNSIGPGGRPSMQVPDAQQHRKQERDDENRSSTTPTSPQLFHLDSQNQTASAKTAEAIAEGPKRQGKGGFFSNYKASKSTSKVNAGNRSQVPDESMPVRENSQLYEMTSSNVGLSTAAEAKKNGMTRPCFTMSFLQRNRDLPLITANSGAQGPN